MKDEMKWILPSVKEHADAVCSILNDDLPVGDRFKECYTKRVEQAESDLTASLDLLESQLTNFDPKEIIDFLNHYKP